ncbi:hypothetical protein AVEN_37190-1 [Araneus ventricosus]|uniref:Uncharacterized protein n=1 Tax=Araneus ventricosus TaxID=182803 RepID=A0A4Y2GWQ3_ARAVE|nr:hypothetical protein AVEN_78347-1 [Araneus ventricosus]GBN30457.1 hypothetical protein AVEN_37190-1 [Araneus ventricosus]
MQQALLHNGRTGHWGKYKLPCLLPPSAPLRNPRNQETPNNPKVTVRNSAMQQALLHNGRTGHWGKYKLPCLLPPSAPLRNPRNQEIPNKPKVIVRNLRTWYRR